MRRRLTLIKTIHTIIWGFFNLVLIYLAYAAISDKIDIWVWIGVVIIILEGVVLLIFRNSCPLTIVARKYSDSTAENFDIYLPNWLAKYNKLIYTTIFIVILSGLIYRIINR